MIAKILARENVKSFIQRAFPSYGPRCRTPLPSFGRSSTTAASSGLLDRTLAHFGLSSSHASQARTSGSADADAARVRAARVVPCRRKFNLVTACVRTGLPTSEWPTNRIRPYREERWGSQRLEPNVKSGRARTSCLGSSFSCTDRSSLSRRIVRTTFGKCTACRSGRVNSVSI